MSKSKIRRIDFSPDEFLSGTSELSLEETGAYWKVCSLIYSRRGPIDDDDRWIATAIAADVRKWKPIKARLVSKGKLIITDGKVSNRRCEAELMNAHDRIRKANENGAKGGRPLKDRSGDVGEIPPEMSARSPGDVPTYVGTSRGHLGEIEAPVSTKNNDITKPDGFPHGKPNHQPSTINHQKEELLVPPQGREYAFLGRVIHLTPEHFGDLENLYRDTIPDLRAEIQSYDEWFDKNVTDEKERREWFHRLKNKLRNKHQQVLRAQRQPAGPNLNESF
jgi:uncharacterized protein YdaU (DUF1376 family)